MAADIAALHRKMPVNAVIADMARVVYASDIAEDDIVALAVSTAAPRFRNWHA